MRFYWMILLTLVGSVTAAEHQDTSLTRSIEVFGAGEVLSVPDQFSFSVSLEQRGQQAAALNQLINQRTQKVVTALLDLGVEKRAIQSLQVQFSPWVEYNGQTREQKGFILTRNLRVTVKALTQYEQAIDKVLALGIDKIYGFSSNNSEPEKHYRLALEHALKSAKQRAMEMAQTLGLKLGEVISISELSTASVRPVIASARQLSQADSFQPGEMPTNARVKVVFSIVNSQ